MSTKVMSPITEMLSKEMEQEAEITRKMLACVPNDKYDWKPHEKSMTVRRLVTHIADIASWPDMAINTDTLDFANNTHQEPVINNTAELLEFFEDSYAKGKTAINEVNEEQLGEPWTMRNGEQVFMTSTRGEIVRVSISQTIHHRAQLGVFLRLLNVPIPGSYGPSADEMGF
jgi:uncharacterized damage-inducible protein DinB